MILALGPQLKRPRNFPKDLPFPDTMPHTREAADELALAVIAYPSHYERALRHNNFDTNGKQLTFFGKLGYYAWMTLFWGVFIGVPLVIYLFFAWILPDPSF